MTLAAFIAVYGVAVLAALLWLRRQGRRHAEDLRQERLAGAWNRATRGDP